MEFEFFFLEVAFLNKSLITRNIFECDIKSFYKQISKTRNVTLIFQNIKKKINVKKN